MEQVTRPNPNNHFIKLAIIINSGEAVNLNSPNLVNIRTFNGDIEENIKMTLSLVLGNKRHGTFSAMYGPRKKATLRR